MHKRDAEGGGGGRNTAEKTQRMINWAAQWSDPVAEKAEM